MGQSNSTTSSPSDMNAAVQQIDYERKRLKHVSQSLIISTEYIEKLEAHYSCLEKSLAAYPDSDDQLQLIRGLHEKHSKGKMKTNGTVCIVRIVRFQVLSRFLLVLDQGIGRGVFFC